MTKSVRQRNPLLIGAGALVGASAVAWLRSRSGEQALEERTRARLAPRASRAAGRSDPTPEP